MSLRADDAPRTADSRRTADSPAGTGLLRAPSRLRGSLGLPADKSITHRALIISALAAGTSAITLREPGEDVRSTLSGLRTLGVAVRQVVNENAEGLRLEVDGLGTEEGIGRLGEGSVDCGNSGTTMRLLAGALAAASGTARLVGDESLGRRPMERVAVPLRLMGADVRTADGHAPITISGRRRLRALEHVLPVPSAQVLGCVCLAALAADGRTTVHSPGPTRDHIERMLSVAGADVTREPQAEGTLTTVVGPARLRASSLTVPGDFSSAAAWIVAATLHPDADIRLLGVGLNPTRTALIDVLRQMGAGIDVAITADAGGEPCGEVAVRSASRLRAVSIASRQVSALVDELPLLAVAMAAANGTSEVRGAAELRVKESDRIRAMAAALTAAGASVDELADGWRISRGRARPVIVDTHGDHRVAMAMAVAAWTGVADGVTLDDPGVVAVSYPSFWRDAASLGIEA